MYIYIKYKGFKNLINKIFYHIIFVIILSIICKLIFIILRIIFIFSIHLILKTII